MVKLARRVHDLLLPWRLALISLVLVTGGPGCVVPPALTLESDGGQNTRPRILEANTTPPPGSKTYRQSEDPLFTITVVDPDRQVLYGRMFMDRRYDRVFVGGESQTGPSAQPELAMTFRVNGICGELVQFVLGAHLLEVYISDSGFVSTGPDLRVPLAGGARVNDSWQITCLEDVKLDGGL